VPDDPALEQPPRGVDRLIDLFVAITEQSLEALRRG
jgi:hypothetical protein